MSDCQQSAEPAAEPSAVQCTQIEYVSEKPQKHPATERQICM